MPSGDRGIMICTDLHGRARRFSIGVFSLYAIAAFRVYKPIVPSVSAIYWL